MTQAKNATLGRVPPTIEPNAHPPQGYAPGHHHHRGALLHLPLELHSTDRAGGHTPTRPATPLYVYADPPRHAAVHRDREGGPAGAAADRPICLQPAATPATRAHRDPLLLLLLLLSDGRGAAARARLGAAGDVTTDLARAVRAGRLAQGPNLHPAAQGRALEQLAARRRGETDQPARVLAPAGS